MKKNICVLLLAFMGSIGVAQNKKILTDTGEKVLYSPVMTTSDRDALGNTPYVGFLIYNIETGCHESYDGTKGWYNYCWNGYQQGPDVSSGGSAVVASYDCSTASAGDLIAGIPVVGVTQTITANVTTIGTYDILATDNGVTFVASGTFNASGLQEIKLTATGTPKVSGISFFTLSKNPGCGFVRTTDKNLTSGGTAVIAITDCPGTAEGDMFIGVAVAGVSQKFTVNVTTAGMYNISTTAANGVTFSGTGTLPIGNNQTIELTATGIPVNVDTSTFVLNTTPSCTFSRTTDKNPTSGGTATIAITDCPGTAEGTLTAAETVVGVSQRFLVNVTKAGTYNIRTVAVNGITFSGTGTLPIGNAQTIELTATGLPVNVEISTFVLNTTPSCTFSRTTNNNPSSNGSATISLADCSFGSTGTLKVGTPIEAGTVTQSLSLTGNTSGTYNFSATANGVTFSNSGVITPGLQVIVLTASGTPTSLGDFYFTLNTNPNNCIFSRTTINNPTSNGTAVIANMYCPGTPIGTMTAGVPVASVSQKFIVNVTTAGTYDIRTEAVNGVTFSRTGTLPIGNGQAITLIATGIPVNVETSTFVLNTTPGCTFSRGTD